MAWLMSALGAALALGGAISLAYGSYFIRMDWGQAETVAGTVALAGGLVTVALGAVLSALHGLARSPARAGLAGAGPAGAGVDAPAMGDVPAARPALRRFTSKLATVGMPRLRPADAAPAAAALAAAAPGDVAPGDAALAADEHAAAPSVTGPAVAGRAFTDPADLDLAVPSRRVPAPDAPLRPTVPPAPEPAAPPPVAPMTIDAPTVVGRYEANGASYVLFSDGTIEVETETGTHRFASMAELKDHIERQETV